MRCAGKRNILGILIDVVDYDGAIDAVLCAAHEKRGMAISALAVHGLMTGVLDQEHKFRLNHFDLLVPDGQPVRWVLNWLHRANLEDRVYGPNLTLRICAEATREGLPVYFYGSTPETLSSLKKTLESRFPRLSIAGMEASKFRCLTQGETSDLVSRIRASGAAIIFVGLGCPRQETFAYELRNRLSIPTIAVGAAFPFLAGLIPQAPPWMQRHGLEWLFRLAAEPLRLWRRYVFLNPAYLFLVTLQASGLSKFSTGGKSPQNELSYG